MEGEGDIHLDFDISGTVLVECLHCSSLVQGSGIRHLGLCYGKGYILGLQLFQNKQSTHDIFCHFPQWCYGDQ